MMTLRNEFSWSTSRDSKFRFCLRAYYYNYYGSWGGWEVDCDKETREAYILKQLKAGKMWAGGKVHEAISHVLTELQTGEEVSLEEATDTTIEEMRREWRLSSKKIYRENPKSCALFDHEYEINRSDGYWKSLAEDVRACIRNFFGSEHYRQIKEIDPAQWLIIDEPSFDKEKVTFDFEGDTVFAKIDFAWKDDGVAHIIDWKTGKSLSDGDNAQFHCYGLFAMEKWGFPIENVRAFESNLYIPDTQEVEVDGGKIDQFKDYMRKGIVEMKALLVDVENNIADKERFPKNEGKTCKWCNFYRLCFPE
jgi:CRISPR/Cas system-associated exonuclease Cas4 (RecB family)